MAPSSAPVERGRSGQRCAISHCRRTSGSLVVIQAAQLKAVGGHMALDEGEERRPVGRTAQRAESASWSGWIVQRLMRSPVHGSGRSSRTGASARTRSGTPSTSARARIWAAR